MVEVSNGYAHQDEKDLMLTLRTAPVPRKKEGRAARLAEMMKRDGHAGGPMIDPNTKPTEDGEADGENSPTTPTAEGEEASATTAASEDVPLTASEPANMLDEQKEARGENTRMQTMVPAQVMP